MERLVYNKDTHEELTKIAEGNKCYWRYQDSCYRGLIPVGQISHERIFEGEAPEFIEEGCSCYDNPYQLLDYMQNDFFDIDTTDVILFVGKHMGYGIDEEDIVLVEEESDVIYSLSAKDFYKFCINSKNLYWNGSYCIGNIVDRMEESFIEKIVT